MTTTATLPDLLTVEETAALLRVKPQTLAVWRSTGRYPALRFSKIGRTVKYPREVVLAFIDGRTVANTGEADELS